jgi:histidinol-phosphate phosphatase family protein
MARKQDKVIFLDRDGVINKDPEHLKYQYVTKWKEFKFLPGVKRAIKKLTDAGYSIYIISNQAGISKKYFTMKDLRTITKKMKKELAKRGGRITDVFYCPHRTEDNCDCRKPKAGLFKKALKRGKIDFKDTFFIGDNIKDVQAGRAIGCRTVLVLSGKVRSRKDKGWAAKPRPFIEKSGTQPDFIKRDLSDAAEFILRRDRTRR